MANSSWRQSQLWLMLHRGQITQEQYDKFIQQINTDFEFDTRLQKMYDMSFDPRYTRAQRPAAEPKSFTKELNKLSREYSRLSTEWYNRSDHTTVDEDFAYKRALEELKYKMDVLQQLPDYVPTQSYNKKAYNRIIHEKYTSVPNYIVKDPDTPAVLGTPVLNQFLKSVTNKSIEYSQEQDLQYHFNGNKQMGRFSRPVTVLDIETGHKDQPISVSAIKGVYDRRTGEFFALDTFETYYTPKNASSGLFNLAKETHGLSPKKIQALRNLQGATYSEYFDDSERKRLVDFMRGSLVVGQNTEQFDFSRLGLEKELQGFSTLDTMVAAENLGIPKGSRGLAALYELFMGRSMEQAGLPHHFSFADVIATAQVFGKMLRIKGKLGDEIRYVTERGLGLSYGKREEFTKKIRRFDKKGRLTSIDVKDVSTALVKGGFWAGLGEGGAGNYMTADELEGLSDIINELNSGYGDLELTDPETGDTVEGFHKFRPGDENILSEAIADTALYEHNSLASAANAFREVARDISATVGTYNVGQRRNEAHRFYNLGTTELKKLATDLGYGDAGVAAFVKEAHAYKEAHDASKAIRLQETVDKAYRRGDITESQKQQLDLIDSYDELNDALEETIEKNRQFKDVLVTISKIPIYDFGRHLQAIDAQAGGVFSAARGVVPQMLINPMQRLYGAWSAGAHESWAPIQSTTNAIGAITGPVASALMHTGNPWAIGAGAAVGAIGATSQIVGNVGEAKINTAGYGLQNTLNTLGFMVDYVTMPFKLLSSALKTATRALGAFGLTAKSVVKGLSNIMNTGLGNMAEMGNPLTNLTGVTYSDYQDTIGLDFAAKLSRGSANSIIEDMAYQQKKFYSLGQVDTGRLIASSLLGVYSDVYSPSDKPEDAFYHMTDTIYKNMQGKSKSEQQNIMTYASMINASLPAILQSMQVLGFSSARDMANPKGSIYWNPLTEGERNAFTKTQYEWRMSKEQRDSGMMRISNRLWNSFGREFSSGFNALLDAIGTGNWKGAIDSAIDMWNMLKDKVTGVWNTIKEKLGYSKDDTFGDVIIKPIKSGFLTLGLNILDWIHGTFLPAFYNIWDNLVDRIALKVSGLVSYLSTFKVDFKKLARGESGWLTSIDTNDYRTDKNNTFIYQSGYTTDDGEYVEGRWATTNEYVAEAADQLGLSKKGWHTYNDLAELLRMRASSNTRKIRAGNTEDLFQLTLGDNTFTPDMNNYEEIMDYIYDNAFYSESANVQSKHGLFSSDYRAKVAKNSAVYKTTRNILDEAGEARRDIEEQIYHTLREPLAEKQQKLVIEVKADGKTAATYELDKVTNAVRKIAGNITEIGHKFFDDKGHQLIVNSEVQSY